jgi:beta-phosphoglucomutase-like phosphatase (HAD superfamily)
MGGIISGTLPIDAVLWDLDGTLIDTSSSSLHALSEILEENEISLTINQLAPIIEQNMAVSASPSGEKKDKESWAREVLKLTSSTTTLSASDLVKKWDDKMLKRRSEIKLLPQALELVQHFHKHNIPQAIATMSNAKAVAVKKHAQPELFKIIGKVFAAVTFGPAAAVPYIIRSSPKPLVVLGCIRSARAIDFTILVYMAVTSHCYYIILTRRFAPRLTPLLLRLASLVAETIVTSSDREVKNRKPHPDCWFVAASRLNVKTHRCVIIEDSPEGMRSGVSAGAKVVGVPAAWSNKKTIGRGGKTQRDSICCTTTPNNSNSLTANFV